MKSKFIFSICLLLGLVAFADVTHGQVTIVDTDFTAAEGFTDGNLQFQNGWLGQGLPQVDSTGTGTVTQTGAFQRNIFNAGALGGVAGMDGSMEGGGASHPTPAGFNIGDVIRIEHEVAFTLDDMTNANLGLSQIGVRSNFVEGGFEAAPNLGLRVDYSNFDVGSLRLFTNFARNGFAGADFPFALVIDAPSIGIDNGFESGGATDFASDNLRLTWEAVYDGADTWTSTEVIVENLTTEAVLATASVDDPDALETVTVAGSGSEAFLGLQHLRVPATNTTTVTTDAVSFTFTTSVAGPDADFDEDGDIDGNDFLAWQRGESPDPLSASDLAAWRSAFGGALSAASSLSAVPEPSTVALCFLALSVGAGIRRSRI